MILANVFCFLFFLGEYLRAGRAARPPEPGAPCGAAHWGAGESPGTRGASGARAGERRGERAAERAGPGRCRSERARAARLGARGPEPRLAGYAGGVGGLGRRLGTPRPPPHTRTHTGTLAYSRTMIALISLKIMGSNCGNLKKEFQLLIWRGRGWGEAVCRGEKIRASSIFLVGSRIDPGGRRGFLQDLLLGHLCGQRRQPSPHLPISLREMHPASRSPNPFPVAPLPRTLCKFLPTLCRARGLGRSGGWRATVDYLSFTTPGLLGPLS